MDPRAIGSVDRVVHGGSDDGTLIDFSVSVNPERPDGVARVYEATLGTARTYPHDDYCEYRVAAGEYVGVEPADVTPTPGGLAAIRLALSTTVGPGDRVLVPAPSFGEFAREIRLQGAEPEFVDHDAVLEADPGGFDAVMVCNPNNPTGEAYDTVDLREFARRCRAAGTPLIADEAYLGFTNRASLAGVPGTIVCRSLTSLFGLPGLRAGFAVATDELGESLETARRTWNLGGPAAAVGTHCMRDEAFVRETRERVADERRRLRRRLSAGYDVHPSDAPFLLLDVGDREVGRLVRAARNEGLAIRDATSFRGLDSHVRVGIRRPAENDRLVEVLRAR